MLFVFWKLKQKLLIDKVLTVHILGAGEGQEWEGGGEGGEGGEEAKEGKGEKEETKDYRQRKGLEKWDWTGEGIGREREEGEEGEESDNGGEERQREWQNKEGEWKEGREGEKEGIEEAEDAPLSADYGHQAKFLPIFWNHDQELSTGSHGFTVITGFTV